MPSVISRRQVYINGAWLGSDETVESGSQLFVQEAVTANQTNLAIAGAFANAKLKYFAAHATVDMSLHTNEATTGTPQEKIFLKAGLTYEWSLTESWLGEVGDSAASPFDGNVTSFFVTNTTAGTLTIIGIVDPT